MLTNKETEVKIGLQVIWRTFLQVTLCRRNSMSKSRGEKQCLFQPKPEDRAPVSQPLWEGRSLTSMSQLTNPKGVHMDIYTLPAFCNFSLPWHFEPCSLSPHSPVKNTQSPLYKLVCSSPWIFLPIAVVYYWLTSVFTTLTSLASFLLSCFFTKHSTYFISYSYFYITST